MPFCYFFLRKSTTSTSNSTLLHKNKKSQIQYKDHLKKISFGRKEEYFFLRHASLWLTLILMWYLVVLFCQSMSTWIYFIIFYYFTLCEHVYRLSVYLVSFYSVANLFFWKQILSFKLRGFWNCFLLFSAPRLTHCYYGNMGLVLCPEDAAAKVAYGANAF